jgi:hypothetical protein
MEILMQLFGAMVVFTYQCFDRVVINGYLSTLSRSENVVYFFRHVLGIQRITKEVLAKRTTDYQHWVEAFARNHAIPIEWAQKAVRKEDRVRPLLKAMKQKTSSASTSFSKVWNRAARFAPWNLSLKPMIPITAF